MKVTEHIQQAKQTLFSIEILPPKKGENIQTLFHHIDSLMEFKPSFIDVTFHREEYVFQKLEDGTYRKSTTRKRPGTIGICAAIQNKYNVDTVPHIICGGFSKEDIENMLIELDFLDIDNVLLLRGDPVKSEPGFVSHPEGHKYACNLIEQVVNLNNGIYLDSELEDATKTDFCIGTAGYPEKHSEAQTNESDLTNLKKKIDAGADFIVTQMFFDNEYYFDFVGRCRKAGITVPIIPGIKPLATINHLSILPKYFFLNIPEALSKEVLKCKDNAAAKEVGIEWAIQQCKELQAYGVPCLHFYTMSRSETIKKVASALF